MLKAELVEENKRLKAENADLRSQLEALPASTNDYRLSVLTEGEILYMVLTNAVPYRKLTFAPTDEWVGDKALLNERLAAYLEDARYDRKLVGIQGDLIDLMTLEGVLNAEHLEDAEIEIMP